MPIDKAFAYHHPSDDSLARVRQLRQAATVFARLIAELAPTSTRERATALTHLESCAMWAIKAVVTNDPTSVAELE